MMVIAIQIPLILILFVLMAIADILSKIANEMKKLREEKHDKDNDNIGVIE